MRKSSFLLYLVQLAVVCHASMPKFPAHLQELPKFKGNYTGRIAGGDVVEGCSFYPYQVFIQFSSQTLKFCGGIIINEDFILTAGHCVEGWSPESITILAGTHRWDLAGGEGEGVRRSAANIIIHQGYDPANRDNDIAVIKLVQPLELTLDCFSAIRLPIQNEEVKDGTTCFATGWGETESSSLSTTLRVVNVPIVSQKSCREVYGEARVTDRMICAGLKEGGKGTCLGDDGGPLVCDGKLAGITSWGHGCAEPNFYGVYTRTALFVDWVNSIVNF